MATSDGSVQCTITSCLECGALRRWKPQFGLESVCAETMGMENRTCDKAGRDLIPSEDTCTPPPKWCPLRRGREGTNAPTED